MVLICITLSSLGLPGVILNPVRDDLRMMAPNAGAARAGAMKQYAECYGDYSEWENIGVACLSFASRGSDAFIGLALFWESTEIGYLPRD